MTVNLEYLYDISRFLHWNIFIRLRFDNLVNNQQTSFHVIPAKAGIQ